MNIANNKRKKDSQLKIQKIFIELIQKKEINEISVSDICKLADLNRSTFYSNYIDIYDLADKIKEDLFHEVISLYPKEIESKQHSYDFLKLFEHIKDNQLFYKTFFKLDYDNNSNFFKEMIDYEEFKKYYSNNSHIEYHIAFFRSGLNAVIKKWLYSGCVESPQEIKDIITSEYKSKFE